MSQKPAANLEKLEDAAKGGSFSLTDIPLPDPPPAKPQLRVADDLRLSAKEVDQQPAAPPEEPGPERGGYAARALMPSSLLCAGLTYAWFREAVPRLPWERIPQTMHTELLFAPPAALWLFQFVRWAYRFWCYRYQLTDDALTPARGFLYPKADGLPLAKIAKVTVSRTVWDWLTFVGQVRVEGEGGKPVVELVGVGSPADVAKRIEEVAAAARESAPAAAVKKAA